MLLPLLLLLRYYHYYNDDHYDEGDCDDDCTNHPFEDLVTRRYLHTSKNNIQNHRVAKENCPSQKSPTATIETTSVSCTAVACF